MSSQTMPLRGMIKWLQLALRLPLRPLERFLPQWLAVSTRPGAFVREQVRLGDTTNFIRAVNFFVFAISTAFLAEVATLYLLGIGNVMQPFYWLCILLTSIPFIVLCFLLVRLVVPLSFKDVLHLTFYPMGAGVFSGAVLTLVASAVVAALVAAGYIPEIRYDFTQAWQNEQEAQGIAVLRHVLYECIKEESLLFTVLAAGLQEAYVNLKSPIDVLSYVRPVVTVVYLFGAAWMFMSAVKHRKQTVFGLVLLAALLAAGMNYVALNKYIEWKSETTRCSENLAERALNSTGDSALALVAKRAQNEQGPNQLWDRSITVDGRTILSSFRLKQPISDMAAFQRFVSERQKGLIEIYCSNVFFRTVKATQIDTFYSSTGEWLASNSVGPTDCPQQ